MSGVYGESPRIIPEKRMREVTAAQDHAARPRIARTGLGPRLQDRHGQPAADFAYSGPLTETCLLGNIAKRVDGRIEWDAENLKITNLPEANRFVQSGVPPRLGL